MLFGQRFVRDIWTIFYFRISPNRGAIYYYFKPVYYFTVGQRKGLNIGGFSEPLFVIETDVSENIIYVGMGESHPGLFKKSLFVTANEIHWIREDLKIDENETMRIEFRIRYRQPLQSGTLYRFKKGLYILFDKPISSVTSGQFVSWYLDDELIGSGTIN